MRKVFLILAVLHFHHFLASGEHIVFIMPSSGYSHRLALWGLVEVLAKKGHEVSFLSPTIGKDDTTHPLVKEVHLPGAQKWLDWFKDNFDINMRVKGLQPPSMLIAEHLMYLSCNAVHEDDNFKAWLKGTKKVDLIFTDVSAECTYGLAKTFGAKHAVFNVLPIFPKVFESFGFPAETSSLPNFLGVTQEAPVSFFARLCSALLPLVTRAMQVVEYELFYKKTFEAAGFDVPELYDMEMETALYLTNADYLDDYPRSVPPFVVRIPGMHVQRAKDVKLDPTVEEFINRKGFQGFVYISFGTFLDASEYPNWFIQMILQTIEDLPNLQFVWVSKYELKATMPNNLLTIKWTAQTVLLAHQKMKAFIYQGGRPSSQEALYNGVPTIVLPFFSEQDYNAHSYARFGTSIVLELGNVTKEVLMKALDRVVNDTVLRSKLKGISEMYKDVPVPSVEKALWWTEFVLRHSQQELNLLKPLAQNQPWFQRRELDVWLFILIFTFGLSWLNFYVTKIVINKCWAKIRRSRSKNKRE